jgi:hypothetical protein
MRSKPLASPRSMTTRCMCIMHINYHFDAVLVLHTNQDRLARGRKMEVKTQCSGAPTEIWYWSRSRGLLEG